MLYSIGDNEGWRKVAICHNPTWGMSVQPSEGGGGRHFSDIPFLNRPCPSADLSTDSKAARRPRSAMVIDLWYSSGSLTAVRRIDT